MARQFRSKNLSVSLRPTGKLAHVADKLRLCVLNSHVCLGWTNCRIFTTYCYWPSWCPIFTCGWGTCARSVVAWCPAGSVDCGPGSIRATPEDILVDPEIYTRQVAELKADLREALAQLEQHEKEIAEATK
jgi:hypothetical protein